MLQPASVRPPPRSSETIRIFPSAVVSAWCEIETLWTLSTPPGSVLFKITAIGLTVPERTRFTSTIQVELIAAT